MKTAFIPLTVTVIFLLFLSPVTAQVFVKADASGNNDGSSWANAFTSLQDGLAASEGLPVWVAAGTYKPAAPGGDETATFGVYEAIEIYGGFAGTEGSVSERDITANPTILSGDLNGDDVAGDFDNNREDNVQSILTIDSTFNGMTIVDGFTFSGGHSDGSGDDWTTSRGGGLLSYNFAQVSNCTFVDNYASNRAGGLYIVIDKPGTGEPVRVDNCSFSGNYTLVLSGGLGLRLNGENLLYELTNSQFNNNLCEFRGGGASVLVAGNYTTSIIENCQFNDNEAQGAAGLYVLTNGQEPSYRISDCSFTDNLATFAPSSWASKGGGLFIFHTPDAVETDGLVENCQFTGNVAASIGGGLGITYQANVNVTELQNCLFENNTSTELANDWGGGAISAEAYTSTSEGVLLCEQSTFQGNHTAGTGGAIDLYVEGGLDVEVQTCHFVNNSADELGMAIHTTGFTGAENGFLKVDNSLFTDTPAGGNAVIHNKDLFSASILNCSIVDNEAVGILQASNGSMSIQNSVLHNPNYPNLMATSEVISLGGNLVTDESMAALLTTDDLPVEDPMFIGTGDHPYQLSEYSPAINAGIPTGDEAEFDLAGNDRIQSSAIDIGAYESPFDMTISSIEELVDNQSLNISPNPAGTYTSLTLDNDWTGELEVRITNAQGQVVQIEFLEKAPESTMSLLEIDHLESGVYTLSISNGKAIVAKSLVKK